MSVSVTSIIGESKVNERLTCFESLSDPNEMTTLFPLM